MNFASLLPPSPRVRHRIQLTPGWLLQLAVRGKGGAAPLSRGENIGKRPFVFFDCRISCGRMPPRPLSASRVPSHAVLSSPRRPVPCGSERSCPAPRPPRTCADAFRSTPASHHSVPPRTVVNVTARGRHLVQSQAAPHHPVGPRPVSHRPLQCRAPEHLEPLSLLGNSSLPSTGKLDSFSDTLRQELSMGAGRQGA